MDNNYYTPKIEEFHVGFEYEFQELPNGKFKSMIFTKFSDQENFAWVNSSCDKPHCLTPIFYRVKYLDREDIEELGWENGIFDNIWSESNEMIKGYSFDISDTQTFIMFHSEEDNVVGIYRQSVYNQLTENFTTDIFFSGYVKNKSELRKLMFQLNIK